jgi:hypothetical protein
VAATAHFDFRRREPLEPITFTATALFKIHHPTRHQPCPEEAEFSGTFAMTSGGEAVELVPSLG